MSYEKIMQEITSGLTGDTEADLAYLMAEHEKYREHEKYKNHDSAQEILRGIGRLLYKLAPEDVCCKG